MGRWFGFFAPGPSPQGPRALAGHACLPRPDRTQLRLVAAPAHEP